MAKYGSKRAGYGWMCDMETVWNRSNWRFGN